MPELMPKLMPEPIVHIQQLWTVFQRGHTQSIVHQNLDLSVSRGEMLALVGGSGTGKSVLLRQILGLETPTQGQITVQGQRVGEGGQHSSASRIGMLFQQGALFSAFSVLDNIAFPLRELKTLPDRLIHDAAMVKLQMVGLPPEAADKMPSDLSGGMIKRVALARALIMDPPLLLLDEPTAGLDPESSDSFCALLRSLHQSMGLTVIMISHDLDTIFELCTRIAVLAERQVIINDVPQKVVAFAHPFIQEFFLGERGQRAMALLTPS